MEREEIGDRVDREHSGPLEAFYGLGEGGDRGQGG